MDDENTGMEAFVEYKENQGVSADENLEVVVEAHERYIYQLEEAICVPLFIFV